MRLFHSRAGAALGLAAVLAAGPVLAQKPPSGRAAPSRSAGPRAKTAPAKSAPAKPAAKPAPAKPARPAPAATRSGAPGGTAAPVRPPVLTAAGLGPVLASLGYAPVTAEGYQRVVIEEDRYEYPLDLRLSNSGDWLVCMAHLATVEDLAMVPSAPLLALLSTNDSLIGMSFSYNGETGRIMLNAAVPNRYLDPLSVRNVVEGIRKTVRETEGLWDTRRW